MRFFVMALRRTSSPEAYRAIENLAIPELARPLLETLETFGLPTDSAWTTRVRWHLPPSASGWVSVPESLVK